jgi:hypothetical protein
LSRRTRSWRDIPQRFPPDQAIADQPHQAGLYCNCFSPVKSGVIVSKSNAFEAAIQALIFHGSSISGIADNTATSPLTQLFLSLHTGDPGEAGDQSTNECAYGAYGRVGVNRDSGGWTITGSVVSPAANVDFPTCTSGSETATYMGIGTASSGAGVLLYSGALSPSISISSGVQPRILSSSTLTED